VGGGGVKQVCQALEEKERRKYGLEGSAQVLPEEGGRDSTKSSAAKRRLKSYNRENRGKKLELG